MSAIVGLLRINYRFNASGRVLGQAPGMRITMDFTRTMISVARMLALGLYLSLAMGAGVAQAQFRNTVYTPHRSWLARSRPLPG